MNNLSANNNLDYAATLIKEGKLVAFPTETVYGLGANALDPLAVAKIFECKERPSFDPLIVHIADVQDLYKLAINIPNVAFKLAELYWPGPLTIVLEKNDIIPDLVTSDLPTVGLRMPNSPIALDLIKRSGCPIAAPSANKFGRVSPTSAEHVKKQLTSVDYVLDGGECMVGIESTIVMPINNKIEILRPGRITREDISKALPEFTVFNSAVSEKINAPGTLKSHYSPTKPLHLFSGELTEIKPNTGIILHNEQNKYPEASFTYCTSKNNSLIEIAANLFASLHAMEAHPMVKQIYIESVPEEGIGIAIMDRMKKAAFQYKEM